MQMMSNVRVFQKLWKFSLDFCSDSARLLFSCKSKTIPVSQNLEALKEPTPLSWELSSATCITCLIGLDFSNLGRFSGRKKRSGGAHRVLIRPFVVSMIWKQGFLFSPPSILNN